MSPRQHFLHPHDAERLSAISYADGQLGRLNGRHVVVEVDHPQVQKLVSRFKKNKAFFLLRSFVARILMYAQHLNTYFCTDQVSAFYSH